MCGQIWFRSPEEPVFCSPSKVSSDTRLPQACWPPRLDPVGSGGPPACHSGSAGPLQGPRGHSPAWGSSLPSMPVCLSPAAPLDNPSGIHGSPSRAPGTTAHPATPTAWPESSHLRGPRSSPDPRSCGPEGCLCPQGLTLDHAAHCPERVLAHPWDPVTDCKPVTLQGAVTGLWLGSPAPTWQCLSFPQGVGTPESATYLQRAVHL